MAMGVKSEALEEDLAIQDTLAMTAKQRLELLANLIVEKICEDQQNGEPLYNTIVGESHG